MARWRSYGAVAAVAALLPLTTAAATPAPDPGPAIELGGAPVAASTDSQRPTRVEAGLWADTLSGPPPGTHYYRYHRTMEGSSVLVGVVAASSEVDTTDAIEVTITPTGSSTECATDTASADYAAPRGSFGLNLFVTASELGESGECLTAPQLDIAISRGDGDRRTDLPLALRIVEEAPLFSSATPPAPATVVARTPTPEGEAQQVTGAASFDDAPDIGTGNYADTVTEATERLYRVRLGWGQSLAVRVDVPRLEGEAAQTLDGFTTDLRLRVISPLRGDFDDAAESDLDASVGAAEPAVMYDATTPVGYQQRFEDFTTVAPGDYWISVAADEPGADRDPVDIPFELTLVVEGEATDPPEFRSSVSGPSNDSGPAGYDPGTPYLVGDGEFSSEISGTPRVPDEAAASDGDVRRVAGGVLGAVSLLCLAAGVLLLRRRVSRPAAR